MPKRGEQVARPTRSDEYKLEFITRDAAVGWVNLRSQARNALADAFDFLSRTPFSHSDRVYPLRADYAYGTYRGQALIRWQYKVTDGARLWYFVDDTPSGGCRGTILIEQVHCGHPKETE